MAKSAMLIVSFVLISLLAGCAGPAQGPLFDLKSREFAQFSGEEFPQSKTVDEQWHEVDGYPMELTEDDFVSMVADSSLPVVVEFYVNWCGYCEEFRPVYRELAGYYKHRIRLATIDAEKSANLKAKLQVQGFPAFFIIKNGKMLDRWYGISGGADAFKKRVKYGLGIE